jgi:hypothetical protein
VPTLRKCLKRPETYLLGVALLLVAFAIDASSRPSRQVSVRIYSAAIHLYQAVGRPVLEGHVRCRYRPTCSVYSERAVRTHGILAGLSMTLRRLASCTKDVPPGTRDPVPPRARSPEIDSE